MPQPNDLSRSLGSKLYWSALRITETARRAKEIQDPIARAGGQVDLEIAANLMEWTVVPIESARGGLRSSGLHTARRG
jgi:hypothetical protein